MMFSSQTKREKTMQVTATFKNTRTQPDTIDQINLAQDLLKAAYRNIELFNAGEKTSRYHFHVINHHDIAVTVVLTRLNCLMVRGKYCATINEVFKAIERQTV